MAKLSTKHVIVLTVIAGLLLNYAAPCAAQIFPGWGNQQPPGGHTLEFVRQDPMPEDMQDITIFTSDEQGISLKIEFPDAFDYDITQGPDGRTYRRYKANSGFRVLGEVGEPEVLYRTFSLQVPSDATDIKIETTEHYFKDNQRENVDLYPIPEIVFEEDEDGLMGSKEVFAIDEEFYQKDTFFPQAESLIIEQGFKHDLHLITIAVPVMTYNPKTSVIKEIKESRLTIKYTSQLQNNIFRINIQKDPFHKVFNAIVPNYAYHHAVSPKADKSLIRVIELRGESLTNPNFAGQVGFHPDFLVIAAKIFDEDEQAHEKLRQWANHRSNEPAGGYHTIAIAYVDEIVEAYPEPGLIEEKIKAFIDMVYTHWRISPEVPNLHFLMLVGDADIGGNETSWFLPTWRSFQGSSDPGDNDYAWLVGDDTLNDLMLGRLPAKDKEELGTMVDKIINFENNPPSGENHYGTRSLMLYGDRHLKTVAPSEISTDVRNLLLAKEQELDEFHTNYLEDLPDFKYNSDIVSQILNTQGALFLGYSAHGSATGGWNPDVNVFDLANNDKLPATVLGLTCATAYFDYWASDCYAEQWIKNEEGGSASYWGATRNSSRSMESSFTNFFSAVFNSRIFILGAAIDLTRAQFSGGTTTIEKHRKIFNLLGDPAVDFSAHISESTKPDLKNVQTISSPEHPEFYNQNISTLSSFENNSIHQVDDILTKLYSIESGEKNILTQWTCSLGAYEAVDLNFDRNYAAESSRHLMTWVDPNNTIEELSEFNNWLNSEINYFPIYVDENNNSGVEHGTQQEPFKEFDAAITYAFEHDLIANGIEDSRPDPMKAITLTLNDGIYGNGDEFTVGSLILRSANGPEKTTLLDSLTIKGSSYYLEGITFKGGGNQDSAVKIRQINDTTRDNHRHMFLRNIFKQWNGYAVDISQDENSSSSHTTYNFFNNNIFFNNYGTISADAKDFLRLEITNNTFTNNEHNLFLVSPIYPYNQGIRMSVLNNIMWDTGNTNGAGAFPDKITLTSAQYNDINDATLWDEELFGLDDTNKEENPEFKEPEAQDYHLNYDSPCRNQGHHLYLYNDPDGSRNDMGAYGGPEAAIRPIRILRPIHGQTLTTATPPPFDYWYVLKWEAYQLEPEDLVHIYLYHYEYELVQPESRYSQPYYHAEEVIDLDVVTENSGDYLTIISQNIPIQTYYLTITNYENPEESDEINFIISSENQSIHSNR